MTFLVQGTVFVCVSCSYRLFFKKPRDYPSIITMLGGHLICSYCHNKISWIGYLIENTTSFLIVPHAVKYNIKMPAGSVSGKGCFQMIPFGFILTWKKEGLHHVSWHGKVNKGHKQSPSNISIIFLIPFMRKAISWFYYPPNPPFYSIAFNIKSQPDIWKDKSVRIILLDVISRYPNCRD